MGRRIDSLHFGRRSASGRAAAEAGLGIRWARAIQRRPLIVAAAGLAVVVLACAPVLAMRLGSADQGNAPTTTSTRRAHDLVVAGFGAGSTGPFTVVMDTRGAARRRPSRR